MFPWSWTGRDCRFAWGDVDVDWIHIRRNKPSHGKVGPPKTKERMAPVPIIDQVRVPLELWRTKCADTANDAWVDHDNQG
jgi:hypothetical protein